MKAELIRSYYKLLHEAKVIKHSGMSELNVSLLTLEMMRIDLELYEVYGHDISLTKKLN
jgi:hypothetical protein